MDAEALWLVCILVTVSWTKPLIVYQPSFVQGIEGGSITLNCSYNLTSKPKVGSYSWVKEPGVEVKNTTREFLGRVTLISDKEFLSKMRADVEIWDLRYYDTGKYVCVVNIAGFQDMSGNGTYLQVLKETTKSPKIINHKDGMVLIWLLVRGIFCAFGIATVATVTRLYYKKTKGLEEDIVPQIEEI